MGTSAACDHRDGATDGRPPRKDVAMSTAPDPKSTPTPPGGPAQARVAPAPADEPHGEDLDPEEDVAPNLGGEDQMQDA
jgi:hypothetical protein